MCQVSQGNSLRLHYELSKDDFTHAGNASSDVKNKLKKMDIDAAAVRKVAIAMYEGEINMIIHAYGGTIDVDVYEDHITMVLKDVGPGISNIEDAMKEGYSTAPEDVINLGFGAGMGLPNMKKNTDEFLIETELDVGTTVTMTVYFKELV